MDASCARPAIQVDLARFWRPSYRAIIGHVAPAHGDAHPQGQRLRPRARSRWRSKLEQHRRALRWAWPIWRRGCACASRACALPGAGAGRHRRLADPRFLEHDLTLTASSVDKLERHRGAAPPRSGRTRQRAPQDRHRHGAHRRALVQRASSCWRPRCASRTRRGGHLHPLRQRRRARPRPRAPAARTLPEVLRFYERRSCPRPLRHAANSGAILQLPRAISIWSARASCSTAPSPPLDVPPALPSAGAALDHAGGVLQGGAAPGIQSATARRWAPGAHDARDHPARSATATATRAP